MSILHYVKRGGPQPGRLTRHYGIRISGKIDFFRFFRKIRFFGSGKARESPGEPGEARGSPGDAGECRGEARSSGESPGELRRAPESSGEHRS